jgi:hypothetical protein
MLDARMDAYASPTVLVTRAAGILRRALNHSACAAYRVTEARPDALCLVATEGLPPEFSDVARSITLTDYEQVADIPYNAEHGSCYGDFFAPVVGAFGIRSWLVASLIDPQTGAITGALLLGSRDDQRFGTEETRQALALASAVSARLAACAIQENEHGLAAYDTAA